jgi:hypothetical protein
MPFDGTGFSAPRRLLHETRCRRERTVALRALDHDVAVAQLLRDARALIENPRNWAQRRYWTLSGRRCAVGALRAVARGLVEPDIAWAAHNLLITVARSRGFGTVEEMNDRSSHSEVLRAFDSAIAAAYGPALAGC